VTLPRWLHHIYALLGGYFWKPCPLCGRPFGGHQWRDRGGLSSCTPSGERGKFVGICPDCIRAGRGTADLSRVACLPAAPR
jgi:hypothetical protein